MIGDGIAAGHRAAVMGQFRYVKTARMLPYPDLKSDRAYCHYGVTFDTLETRRNTILKISQDSLIAMPAATKIEKWKKEIERIMHDVTDSIESRFIFNRPGKIVAANQKISTNKGSQRSRLVSVEATAAIFFVMF